MRARLLADLTTTLTLFLPQPTDRMPEDSKARYAMHSLTHSLALALPTHD